jgi:hypothetical protein
MTSRERLRAEYIAGWYEKDLVKLSGAIRADYIFDDPAESAPFTRQGLEAYMKRWDARAERKNEWRIEHEARQDTNGILTDWHWWQVVGTNLNGAAVVMTSDEGVFLERIASFKRSVIQ